MLLMSYKLSVVVLLFILLSDTYRLHVQVVLLVAIPEVYFVKVFMFSLETLCVYFK